MNWASVVVIVSCGHLANFTVASHTVSIKAYSVSYTWLIDLKANISSLLSMDLLSRGTCFSLPLKPIITAKARAITIISAKHWSQLPESTQASSPSSYYSTASVSYTHSHTFPTLYTSYCWAPSNQTQAPPDCPHCSSPSLLALSPATGPSSSSECCGQGLISLRSSWACLISYLLKWLLHLQLAGFLLGLLVEISKVMLVTVILVIAYFAEVKPRLAFFWAIHPQQSFITSLYL